MREHGDGMTTATLGPGLHRGVAMEEYLRLPAVSASGLEHLLRSPLQYQHYLTEPPAPPSDAMLAGTAVHRALLEPELFGAAFVRGIEGDGRTKAVKDARAALAAEYPDATVLAPAKYDEVTGMRDAILGHETARKLFEGAGEFEATLMWDDPGTGITCKARPDRLVTRAKMLVELKSTRDAAAWAFPPDAERRGYFRKLALYRRGLRAVGWDYLSTVVVAVESAPPHDLACYLVDEGSIDSAEQEVTGLLRRLQHCRGTDTWPGYGEGLRHLARPAWATKQTDTETYDGDDE